MSKYNPLEIQVLRVVNANSASPLSRTYVEGRKLTYKQALELYEKLVQRKATGNEINRMRRRWLAKRRPHPPRPK